MSQTSSDKKSLELQELLRRSKEEINEFAYIVTHDLKAPLRSVTSLAQWIHDDHGEALNEDGKEQLKLLLQSVTRLTQLFDGVLEYSRAGKLTAAPNLIDTEALLKKLSKVLPANISLDAHDLRPAFGETVKIEKLFSELIKNAVEALSAKGGVISVNAHSENGMTHFILSDTGRGLDPKFHKSVFQIFRRGAAAESQEHIGLGLSVAKRIVEAHGGEIWIVSSASGGAEVHFTLPEQEI